MSAEDKAAEAALEAISKGWATSDAEKVEENSKPLKYSGFEKEIGPGGRQFFDLPERDPNETGRATLSSK